MNKINNNQINNHSSNEILQKSTLAANRTVDSLQYYPVQRSKGQTVYLCHNNQESKLKRSLENEFFVNFQFFYKFLCSHLPEYFLIIL